MQILYVGSSRQRIWYVAEKLKEQYGYQFDIMHTLRHSSWIPGPKHYKTLISLYKKIRSTAYDYIYIHKAIFPIDVILIVFLARRSRSKILFDLDDGEWLHSNLKTKMLTKRARRVLAGSHEIMHWAKKYNKDVTLLPTVVDDDAYHKYTINHKERQTYTIGWVGDAKAHFKMKNFHEIIEPLKEITKSFKIRFVIIGSRNYQPIKDFFKDAPYEVKFIDSLDWKDPESNPMQMLEENFDVGIMPLADTPFNRAKCGYKAIEYMASGIPAVVSTLGENIYVVPNGKAGFHARSCSEWIDTLTKLLTDVELRKRMGAYGQKWVKENYSYDSVIPRFNKFFTT
jgi:glycosyltransferase involved in cell wall biosynthesis